ncbi:hypothetical protein [Aliamphritea spongicola]|nr:hypothetical protein [Aliamphritea spongicola]
MSDNRLLDRLARFHDVSYIPPVPVAQGHITRLIGLTLEAVGIKASMGITVSYILKRACRLKQKWWALPVTVFI